MADSNRIKHLSNFICLKEITYKERTCFHLRKGNVFKKEKKRRMDLTFFAKETKKRGAIVRILWISWIQKGVLSHFPSYRIPHTYTYTQRHIPYSFTIWQVTSFCQSLLLMTKQKQVLLSVGQFLWKKQCGLLNLASWLAHINYQQLTSSKSLKILNERTGATNLVHRMFFVWKKQSLFAFSRDLIPP